MRERPGADFDHDPVAQHVAWTLVSAMTSRDTSYRLMRDGTARWEFRKRETATNTVAYACLLLFMTGVPLWASADVRLPSEAEGFAATALAFGLIPLLIVFFVLLAYVQGRVVAVVDVGQQCIWRPRTGDGEPWCIPFHRIHSLQVLRAEVGTDVGQCNLVLTTGRRVHVITQGSGAQVARDARRIAAHMDVPIWEAAPQASAEKPSSRVSRAAEYQKARAAEIGGPVTFWKDMAAHLRTRAGIVLLLINIVPLVGVAMGGWHALPIFAIYWCENVVVGAITVLRLAAAVPSSPSRWRIKAMLIPLFTVHYGAFMWMHALSIMTVLGGTTTVVTSVWNVRPLVALLMQPPALYFVLPLLVQNGVSSVRSYVTQKEYACADLAMIMATPYARVLILHVALILSGALLPWVKPNVAGIVILVAIKTYVDFFVLMFEHSKRLAGPNSRFQ